ncbi:hypothetical protein [Paraburkholderia sp.]|uniref:hypothetical protein n=1 Tax=Paraburkholderia sp. TaxID=1926495 RepID=UPI0025FA91BF|nr:hypothetical protein [Paraburkholderia sp.]
MIDIDPDSARYRKGESVCAALGNFAGRERFAVFTLQSVDESGGHQCIRKLTGGLSFGRGSFV